MSMSAEFFKNLNQSIRINWNQLPQEFESYVIQTEIDLVRILIALWVKFWMKKQMNLEKQLSLSFNIFNS